MSRVLNLKLGQEVAVRIKDFSNARQRLGRRLTLENIDDWCFTGVVTKITKKYITVEYATGTDKTQFSIEDDYNERYKTGGSDYQLYESKEDIITELKVNELRSSLKDMINNSDNQYTLDQLERVMSILNE